jgi:hypothetical protein
VLNEGCLVLEQMDEARGNAMGADEGLCVSDANELSVSIREATSTESSHRRILRTYDVLNMK